MIATIPLSHSGFWIQTTHLLFPIVGNATALLPKLLPTGKGMYSIGLGFRFWEDPGFSVGLFPTPFASVSKHFTVHSSTSTVNMWLHNMYAGPQWALNLPLFSVISKSSLIAPSYFARVCTDTTFCFCTQHNTTQHWFSLDPFYDLAFQV